LTAGATLSTAAVAYYDLSYSLVCLVLGGLFATLFSAYTVTGHVGVSRLKEKAPTGRARLLARWESRWDVLRTSLLLCSIVMEVGFVLFAVRGWAPAPERISLSLAVIVLVTVFIFSVVFNILPRALSQTHADRITLLFLPLAAGLARLLYPAAWPIVQLGHALHLAFMAESERRDRPTPAEEIRSVVDRASTTELEDGERQILQSVLEFRDTITREIMTPRVDIKSLEDTDTIADCVRAVKDSPYSRFPVYHDTLDDVRGVVHVKDMLWHLDDNAGSVPVIQAVKEVPFVTESMPISDLLTLMRSEKAQIAIVVDEYGGTAGLVSIEDIVEELVGEILDEYDPDQKRIQRLSDGSAIVDARLPVDEVNTLLALDIPEDEDYDSIGGFVFHELGRIPRPGELIEGPNYEIMVQTANAHQLHTLRVLEKRAQR